jgi:EPS-associated MarR family transcriptional regulator
MASRRKEYQEDAKLRVMKMINQNPRMTSREIAQKVGISNGSAYYLLSSLVDKGFVKLSNFKDNSQKLRYFYLLTPKGMQAKSLLTHNFIIRKKEEYRLLKEELDELERDVGLNIQEYNKN